MPISGKSKGHGTRTWRGSVLPQRAIPAALWSLSCAAHSGLFWPLQVQKVAPLFSFRREMLLILWTAKTDVPLTICQKHHSKNSTIKNGSYL